MEGFASLKQSVKSSVVKNVFNFAGNYVLPKLSDEAIIKLSDKINNFEAPAGKIFFDHIFIIRIV